jgi:hypothetical protein
MIDLPEYEHEAGFERKLLRDTVSPLILLWLVFICFHSMSHAVLLPDSPRCSWSIRLQHYNKELAFAQ